MSNVALDLEPNGAHAYIFDAGVVKRNVAGRDIAVIEASVLLHQRIEHEVFVRICSILYGPATSGTEDVAAEPVVGIAKEIVEFIQALREAANPWNDLEIYALMVFDFVLIQVGGLAFGSYGNRIVGPAVGGVSAGCGRGMVSTGTQRESDLSRLVTDRYEGMFGEAMPVSLQEEHLIVGPGLSRLRHLVQQLPDRICYRSRLIQRDKVTPPIVIRVRK